MSRAIYYAAFLPNRSYRGYLRDRLRWCILQHVGFEAADGRARPGVDSVGHGGLQGGNFIAGEHLCCLFNIAKAADVVRQHAHQLGRHAVRGQHVVAAGVLDVQEVVFGCHLADGDQLDPFLLSVGRVVKQVSEVAHALGFGQLLAHLVDIALVLGRVRHVQDETRVAAIVVVAAAERAEVETELKAVAEQLDELGKRRSDVLGFLSSTDVFAKYKQVTDDLVTLRADIATLEKQRGFLRRLQELRGEIRALTEACVHLQSQIKADVESQNTDEASLFSVIRVYFSEIVEEVLAHKALLSVSPREWAP